MSRQRGAALLLAMLTVALVATLASAALWRQWRAIEVEGSERARLQASWMLSGALDWARLILREDARSGAMDHLGEPWAVVLQESRVSSFLAMEGQDTSGTDAAFLSGGISDAQSRMNITNLVAAGKLSEPDHLAFARLFERLGLESAVLERLTERWLLAAGVAADGTAEGAGKGAPLRPRHLEQLAWLGLNAETLRVLQPHVVLLPARTPLNLNTAGIDAIYSSVPGLELAEARKFVEARQRQPLRSLAEAQRRLPADVAALAPGQFSVASRFFEVRGRLRIDTTVVEEHSLLDRTGNGVFAVWRERVAPVGPVAPVPVR